MNRNLVDYRNVRRVSLAGRSFASKLEANTYLYLLALEQNKEISDIQCQPHVFLTDARIEMIPDFRFFDLKLNEVGYAEAKGFETDVWRLKRRLWIHYGPGKLQVYKGSGARVKLVETITPRWEYK